MARKLYVGNLPYSITEGDLESMFTEHGSVDSARLILDRASGRSKGFGFVEMSSDEEAENAISALNGKELDGRAIVVNEARPLHLVAVASVVVAAAVAADTVAAAVVVAVDSAAAADAAAVAVVDEVVVAVDVATMTTIK